uniref:Glutathione S-transferase D9 n=1 Tax=Bemisia tabaci TaxID=7038 RepID=A0A6C0M9S5_BEMTA|nr:glutathione S-transferase D9 [Bemisia tabaci]QHU79999.1 glutathione S-transferase D9 [Bemisia tabaci]QHU80000.1 glutathione S-transferase D9 [Bemisia tabaci]QHU80001.1 glutathione S-transferase D9 [Bemisia tabaci]QHU80003.1 glutathione S-transferase D9 [Bemisia tabaci]
MDLYYYPTSPPCLSVVLLTRELGLTPNLKVIDITAAEHMESEYRELNIQHTVPCLDDSGFVLSESRAILIYLVETYGRSTSLYPSNTKHRATVHQMLFFDQGTIYQRIYDYYIEPVFFSSTPLDENKLKKLEDGMEVLDLMLEKRKWAAGSDRTIADFALFSTVSVAKTFGFDFEKYTNIMEWHSKVQSSMEAYQDLYQAPLETVGELFQNKLADING